MDPVIDAHLWLQGDEDGDVSAQCRSCNRGGEPVVFYTSGGQSPYGEARVPTARTIADLVALMHQHLREVHGMPRRRPIEVRMVRQ